MLSDDVNTTPAVSYSEPGTESSFAPSGEQSNDSFNSNPIDLGTDDMVSQIKLSKPLKLHVIVALCATALCTIIWFFVGIAKSWFSWFLIPAFVFIVTLSVHFYIIIKNKEFLQCHMVIYTALNIMLILFWINDISTHIREKINFWFIYPLAATSLLLSGHYLYIKRESTKQFFITFHGVATVVLSAMFFFIWMSTSSYSSPPAS